MGVMDYQVQGNYNLMLLKMLEMIDDELRL